MKLNIEKHFENLYINLDTKYIEYIIFYEITTV